MQAIAGLPKVVPYVDVPLQHVDGDVLRAMGRWTSERTVRALVGQRLPVLAERLDDGVPRWWRRHGRRLGGRSRREW